jgi:hypothetical protein
MQVSDQGPYSQIIGFTMADPEEGARNFVYVSVIDQEAPVADPHEIYNYEPSEAEMLLNMQVGESKPVREVMDVAKRFTYQRLPDAQIGGHAGQSYENLQPWEFPDGTKELRTYLLLDGCTYLIGGYLDVADSNLPGAISEDLFGRIMATIRFGS